MQYIKRILNCAKQWNGNTILLKTKAFKCINIFIYSLTFINNAIYLLFTFQFSYRFKSNINIIFYFVDFVSECYLVENISETESKMHNMSTKSLNKINLKNRQEENLLQLKINGKNGFQSILKYITIRVQIENIFKAFLI